MSNPPTTIQPAEIYSRRPHAQFIAQNLQPNSPLYIGSDDTFVIDAQNTAAGVVIQIVGRYMDTDGRLVPFAYQFSPAADRTLYSLTFDLSEGWLISMSLGTATTGVISGQCFVRAFLYRGSPPSGQLMAQFMASYITSNTWANWPFGTVTSSLAGPGRNYQYLATNPPAGTELTVTVPPHARWRPINVYLQLVCGAAVANRQITLNFNTGANPFVQVLQGPPLAASTTGNIQWMLGIGSRETALVNNTLMLPMPPVILDPGTTIKTATSGLQAADFYNYCSFYIEEWLVP